MKFEELEIQGVFLIHPDLVEDQRGVFRRAFCRKEYGEAGLPVEIQQTNVSENRHARTLRGFHYQLPPHWEPKTMACAKGALFTAAIDLRRGSATFGRWVSTELTEENRRAIHTPAGVCNAFLTLEDHTAVHYYMFENYVPGAARGVRFDDPFFNVRWPAPPAVISEKDAGFPDFDPDRFDKA